MTDIELKNLKDRLWHSADMLRAGAHLAANKYGQPILGLTAYKRKVNDICRKYGIPNVA